MIKEGGCACLNLGMIKFKTKMESENSLAKESKRGEWTPWRISFHHVCFGFLSMSLCFLSSSAMFCKAFADKLIRTPHSLIRPTS